MECWGTISLPRTSPHPHLQVLGHTHAQLPCSSIIFLQPPGRYHLLFLALQNRVANKQWTVEDESTAWAAEGKIRVILDSVSCRRVEPADFSDGGTFRAKIGSRSLPQIFNSPCCVPKVTYQLLPTISSLDNWQNNGKPDKAFHSSATSRDSHSVSPRSIVIN